MANLFAGALLKGLGDGSQMVGQQMLQEQARQRQREEELRLRRELDSERLQEQAALRAAAMGPGGGGSRAGGGSGRGNGIFNRASAEEQLAFATDFASAEDLRQYKAGSNKIFEQERELDGPVEEDGTGPGMGVGLPPGVLELRAKKSAEIKARAEEVLFGGQYDDVTKGRRNQQRVEQLDRYEAGNDRSGKTVLIDQGKDIYGGPKEVTRDVVTGDTSTTRVGDAKIGLDKSGAAENYANAEKYRAEAQKFQAEGGVKGATRERLSTQLNSVNAAINNLTENVPRSSAAPEAKAAHREALQMFQNLQRSIGRELEGRLEGSPPAPASATPAPAPAPVASAPGQKRGKFASTDAEKDRALILNTELAAERQRLASATDPEQQARSRRAIEDLRREMKRAKVPERNVDAPVANNGAAASQSPTRTPPPGAINALRSRPELAEQFDAKYGQGAAARVLRAPAAPVPVSQQQRRGAPGQGMAALPWESKTGNW